MEGFFLNKKQTSAKNTDKVRLRAVRSIAHLSDAHHLNFQNSIPVCLVRHTDLLQMVGSLQIRVLDRNLCCHGSENEVFTSWQFSRHLQSGTKVLRDVCQLKCFRSETPTS